MVKTGTLNIDFIKVPDLLIIFRGLEIFKHKFSSESSFTSITEESSKSMEESSESSTSTESSKMVSDVKLSEIISSDATTDPRLVKNIKNIKINNILSLIYSPPIKIANIINLHIYEILQHITYLIPFISRNLKNIYRNIR